jgi:3-oxoacyl-[acyl-carrier protein] reductase
VTAVEINLADKALLITGAAGGIGQCLVARALAADARVAAFDLREVQIADHPNLLKLQGDATEEEAVCDAIAQLQAKWQRLDVLINNAGKAGSGRVESLSLAAWNEILHANLTSNFLCSKHAIPLLKATRGVIVNLSSTNGLTGGSPLSGPAYAAAKAGIIALTKNLARDLASAGVRVNAIAPGPIATPMLDRFDAAAKAALQQSIPLGELGTVEDVANLVFFLVSDAAKHFTGTTISLSGGLVM